MAIKINRSQRDAIYEEVVLDLHGIGDIAIALDGDDYDIARRYRRRFEDDMRLLDDIGWEPGQDREEYELTMPADDLARLVGYFSKMLGASLREHFAEPDDARRLVERELAAQTAFAGILPQAVTRDDARHGRPGGDVPESRRQSSP
jgi:hypothetical protein